MAFNFNQISNHNYIIHILIFFYKLCDVFISVVERCENIMLTLVKRSTERYYASFTTRFCNVPIT